MSKEVREHPSPDNLHLLGVSYLLLRKPNEAVQSFEQALRQSTKSAKIPAAIRQSTDAALLSDLSAAYSARAVANGSVRDRLGSVEAGVRARQLGPSPEAAWNLALAFETVELPDDARDAWEASLRDDLRSPWSPEVRERIEELRRPTFSELWRRELPRLEQAIDSGDLPYLKHVAIAYPQESRTYVEETLLPAWGRRLQIGDSAGATCALNAAEAIAAAQRSRTGEALLDEAVRAIRHARVPEDLARGHVAYAEGRAQSKKNQFDAAAARLREAEELLGREHSPMELVASTFLASCAYNRNDYDEALRRIEQVFRRSSSRSYFAIGGWAHWIAGISESSKGNVHVAIDHYEAASRMFTQLGETDNILAIKGLLATTHDTVGDRDGGWALRLDTLDMLQRVGLGSRRIAQTLAGAAVAAQRDGYALTAIAFLDRELAVAEGPGAADLRAMALVRRGELKRLIGDAGQAARDFDRARATASAIEDRSVRDFVVMHPSFIRATIAGVGNREQRLSTIRAGYDFAAKIHNAYRQIELLLAQGEEQGSGGELQEAATSLDRVLSLIESEQKRLPDLALRDADLDQRSGIYRELVEISVQRGDLDAALRYAERGRARSLREAFEGSLDLDAPALDSIRARIPPGTAVVYYVTLPDRLLTWIIARDRVAVRETRILQESLRALTEGGGLGVGRILLEPWLGDAQPFSTLVIVPDDPLYNVEFAALRADGRYLIETHRLIVAPSLALFVRCLERDRSLAAHPRDGVLLVSAGGVQSGSALPPLPRVADEIAAVRAIYPTAVVLEDPDASKRDFFRLAPASTMIHFAGHGLANDAQPSYSALVLPRGESRPAEYLYAHEIAEQRLPDTRLAVISACDSLKSGAKSHHGISSIGRAFIAAGVPAVVGTVRDVDDAVAARVFRVFYKRLGAGDDPAEALRAAQLDMLKRSADSDWSAFYLAGGVNESRGKPWIF